MRRLFRQFGWFKVDGWWMGYKFLQCSGVRRLGHSCKSRNLPGFWRVSVHSAVFYSLKRNFCLSQTFPPILSASVTFRPQTISSVLRGMGEIVLRIEVGLFPWSRIRERQEVRSQSTGLRCWNVMLKWKKCNVTCWKALQLHKLPSTTSYSYDFVGKSLLWVSCTWRIMCR